jgi:hypothetical protein
MTGPLAPAWTSYILQLKQPVLAVGAGFVEGSAAVRPAEQGVHAGVSGFGDFFHCSRTGRRAWSVCLFGGYSHECVPGRPACQRPKPH